MYDASKLAEETDTKLSGLIKQVSHCCWPGRARVVHLTLALNSMVLEHGYKTVGAMQAEELKAYSQKRMKELEKEIQDCEAAKVRCCYAA